MLLVTVCEDNGAGCRRLLAYFTSKPRCILSYLMSTSALKLGAYGDCRCGFAFLTPLVLTLRNQVRLTMAVDARKLLYVEKVPYDLGALIEALHHSTSPARGPVQAGMQSIVPHPNDNSAFANYQCIHSSLKALTVLGWHPQDELAR